jgi:hypothetical protein
MLWGCRTPRYIYSPAAPNNPYFREKGEMKLSGYYSTNAGNNELVNEYNYGTDLQAAWAIGQHWAFAADYYSRKEKDAIYNYDRSYFDSSVVRYKRKMTGAGAGYFTSITQDQRIIFSIYGGLGFGKFSFDDIGIDNGSGYSRFYKSNMSKWYLQPGINFYASPFFRTAITGKFSFVHYSRVKTNYTTDELLFLNLNYLPGNTLTVFETGWNFQATLKGMEWLWLDGSFVLSSDPYSNDTNLEARNFNASIGLSIYFNKKKIK